MTSDERLDRLTAELKDFVQERNWQQFQTPKNLVMALTAEVGELTEHFMWLAPTAPVHREAVAEEIADVFIYLLHLSAALGIDPVGAAEAKLEKARLKYPVETSKILAEEQ